jgi:hypothetical protein
MNPPNLDLAVKLGWIKFPKKRQIDPYKAERRRQAREYMAKRRAMGKTPTQTNV